MSPSAHYVTQTSIYDCPKLGRLTNARIEHYRKLGYYSTGFVEERKARIARKGKSRATVAREVLARLLEDFTE
jgi:hypothetical protein